ncbi:hypothetical protein RB653_004222 [Dictyostelium firmibasis]|uniref:Uncharacterized protein n=1 Tax=Dictyostelium firmibasis TaxID=79012 RepID=A0AAN7YZV9_9MYCE
MKYCYDNENYPNVTMKTDGIEVNFKYEFFENKNKCKMQNISLVCWNWFQISSKLFDKINKIKYEEKKKKKDQYNPYSTSLFSPYSPTNNSFSNLYYLQNEKTIKKIFKDYDFNSKYKLLNFNNVQFINSNGYSLETIMNNFKNIIQIKIQLPNKNKRIKDKLNEIKKVFSLEKNKDLSITLHLKNSIKLITNSVESLVPKEINLFYCDYLIFDRSKLNKNEMLVQLKFIEKMNPIQLHFRCSGIHLIDSFQPHHYFTKEFFNNCNRMKTFIFDGDFLDFQFLNMAIESSCSINTIKALFLFHDLQYHLEDPLFVNEIQYDNIFLNEAMYSNDSQPIPFKSFSCSNYESTIPYDHSYINYLNEFQKLCENIKKSKSIKHFNLSNFCSNSTLKCRENKLSKTKYKKNLTKTPDYNDPIDSNFLYKSFFNALEFNCSLTKLTISNWNFENQTDQLIDSLSKNKSITNLSLIDGTLNGDNDLPLVSKLLVSTRTNKICKLNVSFNNFSDIDQLIKIINDSEKSLNQLVILKINGFIKELNQDKLSYYDIWHYNMLVENEIQSKINSDIKNRNVIIRIYKSSSDKDICI